MAATGYARPARLPAPRFPQGPTSSTLIAPPPEVIVDTAAGRHERAHLVGDGHVLRRGRKFGQGSAYHLTYHSGLHVERHTCTAVASKSFLPAGAQSPATSCDGRPSVCEHDCA